jgi:hypothetical protein
MLASAGLSFILYLFVFFRLRGNVTVSGGYKVHFHQRPKVRVGRTDAGAYIVTDDRRVESHSTTVGKLMLWHPIAYIVLVLPFAASRCYSFSVKQVPFAVTIFTSAIFVLGGFVNAVLFCTTRNVLPERWRQRLSTGTTLGSGRGGTSLPSRRGSARRVESGARKGVVGTGLDSVILNIGMEKEIEFQCHGRGRSPSSLKFSPPTTPTWPLQAYSGRQRADTEGYIRHPSFSTLRNEGLSIRSSDCGASDFSAGVRSVSKLKEIIEQVPDQVVHPSNEQEIAIHESLPGLETPVSFHPFDTNLPANTDTRHARPTSILTFENAVYQTSTHLSWGSGDFGSNGGGTHRPGHKIPTQQISNLSPAVDEHPYSMPYPGTGSRRPFAY